MSPSLKCDTLGLAPVWFRFRLIFSSLVIVRPPPYIFIRGFPIPMIATRIPMTPRDLPLDVQVLVNQTIDSLRDLVPPTTSFVSEKIQDVIFDRVYL